MRARPVVASVMALSLIALLGAQVASAAGSGSSAMVLEFDGKKTKPLHERVFRALKKEHVPVQAAGADAIAARGDADELEAVARRHEVTVFVEGESSTSKHGAITLHLTAKNAATGEQLAELSLDAPKLAGLLKRIDAEVPGFVKDQLDAVEATSPPETAATAVPDAKAEAVVPKEASAEPEPKDTRPAHRPSPFSVTVGVEIFSRRFSYNQDVNANLRPYKVGPAPALVAGVAWYPAAHFTGGPPAHLGIVGDIEESVAASSALDPSGTHYSTSMQGYSIGLRGRVPLGVHELGISARYGHHAFKIEGDTDPNGSVANGAAVHRDLVPDVAYDYLRPGVDARFAFGAFGVGAYVGYRFVLSAGGIQDAVWFPNAKVTAVDAGLVVTYEVVRSLRVLGGFNFRRYGFDMHSSPADLAKNRDVAGGAVDQYLAGLLGIEWQLPGD